MVHKDSLFRTCIHIICWCDVKALILLVPVKIICSVSNILMVYLMYNYCCRDYCDESLHRYIRLIYNATRSNSL